MAEEIDISKLSLEERCTHKVWKIRMGGYEEAGKCFLKWRDDAKNPEYSKFSNLIKSFVSESNVVAQEKGLEAALIYMENAYMASKIIGEVATAIISKSFTSKAKSKEIGFEILMQGLELEKQDIIIEELLKGQTNKSPKIAIACSQMLKEAIKAFGPKLIPVKPLLKQIPILLDNRDFTIREEAKQLVYTIYQWLGNVITPALQSLKPIQLQELEAEFVKINETGEKLTKPARLTRAQKQMIAVSNVTPNMTGDNNDTSMVDGPVIAGQVIDTEIDPYELIEAADVLSQITRKFYDKLGEKAWQERKEAMEHLKEILTPLKYETNGDYHELIKSLRNTISKDTNIIVVTLAAENLARLAKGLRKKFSTFANGCVTTILEKFKEKKPTVLNALKGTIDAVFQTTTLEAISEDVVPFLSSKNPSVRQETVSFLGRSFAKCNVVTLNKRMVKLFAPLLIQTINDSDPSVREFSAETLGIMMKIVGEKPLMCHLEDLDKVKLDKVKENCAKCEVSPPPLPPQPKNTSAGNEDDKQQHGSSTDGPSSRNAGAKGSDDKTKKKANKGGVAATQQPKRKTMLIAKSTDNLNHENNFKEPIRGGGGGGVVNKINSKSRPNLNTACNNETDFSDITASLDLHNLKYLQEAMDKASQLLPLSTEALKGLSGKDLQERLAAVDNITQMYKKAMMLSSGNVTAKPTTSTHTSPTTSITNNGNNLHPTTTPVKTKLGVVTSTLFTELATLHSREARVKEDEFGFKALKWTTLQTTAANSGGGTSTSLSGSSGPQPKPPEYAIALRDQFEQFLGPTLKTDMFHRDFKYQIRALDNIITLMNTPYNDNPDVLLNLERLFHCSDLFLKWLALKFCDTNTTLLLKCYEFLARLFESGNQFNVANPDSPSKLQLHDCEIGFFIPYLLTRAGDPKELIRKQVRVVIRSLTDAGMGGSSNGSIYPANRVWPYLFDALRTSKIAKHRQDILEEFCRALKTYGVRTVFGSTGSSANINSYLGPACKITSLFLGDRDPLTRGAAVTLLATCYSQCKDVVFKLMSGSGASGHSTLTVAEQTALEDKIKKLAATILPPPLLNHPKLQPQQRPPPNPNTATLNLKGLSLGGLTLPSLEMDTDTMVPPDDEGCSSNLKGSRSTNVKIKVSPITSPSNIKYVPGPGYGGTTLNGYDNVLTSPAPNQSNKHQTSHNRRTMILSGPNTVATKMTPSRYSTGGGTPSQQLYNPRYTHQLDHAPGNNNNNFNQAYPKFTENSGTSPSSSTTPGYPVNGVGGSSDLRKQLNLKDTSEADSIISKPIVFPAPKYRRNNNVTGSENSTPDNYTGIDHNNNKGTPLIPTLQTPNLANFKSFDPKNFIKTTQPQTPDNDEDEGQKSSPGTSLPLPPPRSTKIPAFLLGLQDVSHLGNDTYELLRNLDHNLNSSDSDFLLLYSNDIIESLTHQIRLLHEIYLPRLLFRAGTALNSHSDELTNDQIYQYYSKVLSLLTSIFLDSPQNSVSTTVSSKPSSDSSAATVNSTNKIIKHTNPALRDLSQESLFGMIDGLVKALVDMSTPPDGSSLNNQQDGGGSAAGSQQPHNPVPGIQRKLNVLIVKVIEIPPLPPCLCALLKLLKDSVRGYLSKSGTASELEELDVTRRNKRLELVMKCIWKATKLARDMSITNPTSTITAARRRCDPDNLTSATADDDDSIAVTPQQCTEIMNECQEFLAQYPSSFWKGTDGQPCPPNDIPIRTLKTLIHNITLSLGSSLLHYVKPVESLGDGPKEELYRYILRVLKTSNMSMENAPADPVADHDDKTESNQTHDMEAQSDNQLNVISQKVNRTNQNHFTTQNENQLDQSQRDRLASIFLMIGDRDTSKNGLEALYDFKMEYPGYDIQAKLVSTTPKPFKDYVEQGLTQIALRRANTTSSITTPTTSTTNNLPHTNMLNTNSSRLDKKSTYPNGAINLPEGNHLQEHRNDALQQITTAAQARERLKKYENLFKQCRKRKEDNKEAPFYHPQTNDNNNKNDYDNAQHDLNYNIEYLNQYRKAKENNGLLNLNSLPNY